MEFLTFLGEFPEFMLKYLLKLDLGNEDKVREGEKCFDRARTGNEEPNVELPD